METKPYLNLTYVHQLLEINERKSFGQLVEDFNVPKSDL